MTVNQIPFQEFLMLLRNQGLKVAIGPFNVRIHTHHQPLIKQLYMLYSHYRLVQDEIIEFHVRINTERSIRNPLRLNVRFLIDGQSPFESFPEEQALAVLEWGINLAIAVRVNHLLLLHSAVVEKKGAAILLISEDLDEIFALADRVAVLYEGDIMDVMLAAAATEDRIGLLMAGVR